MKRSKIALALAFSTTTLLLSACNDSNDDYQGAIKIKVIFQKVIQKTK
jgi:hypothetical protein